MYQSRPPGRSYYHEASYKYQYVKKIPQIPIPDTNDNTIIWDVVSINNFANKHSLGHIVEGWFNDRGTHFIVGEGSFPVSFIRSDHFKLVESPTSGPFAERGALGIYRKGKSKKSKSKGREKKRYSRKR